MEDANTTLFQRVQALLRERNLYSQFGDCTLCRYRQQLIAAGAGTPCGDLCKNSDKHPNSFGLTDERPGFELDTIENMITSRLVLLTHSDSDSSLLRLAAALTKLSDTGGKP